MRLYMCIFQRQIARTGGKITSFIVRERVLFLINYKNLLVDQDFLSIVETLLSHRKGMLTESKTVLAETQRALQTY